MSPPLATTPNRQEGSPPHDSGYPSADQDHTARTRVISLVTVPAAVTALLSTAAAWVAAGDAPTWARIAAPSLALAGIAGVVFVAGRSAADLIADRDQHQSPLTTFAPEPPAEDVSASPPRQGQDALRAGFANLAHRLQTLIHQAIHRLDQLERQVEDPDLLESFFKLDHLITRMLRQAESLAVLGGEPLQRQANHPVHVHGLQRSALSETEHYQRVTIAQVPEGVAVRGHVLGEIIHLLAELLENATTFSSPHAAKVRIGAETVPSGLSLWVEDRGLGIEDQQRQRLNELIADPGAVDLGELLSDGRIGLATVAEIAHRHGIRVRLDNNIFGGTLAWVVLPHTLLDAPASHPVPSAPAPPRAEAPVSGAEASHDHGLVAAEPDRTAEIVPTPIQGNGTAHEPRSATTGHHPTGWDALSPPDESTPIWPEEAAPDTSQQAAEPTSPTPAQGDQRAPKHARPPLPKRTKGQLPPELYRRPTHTDHNAEANPDLMGAFWGGELEPRADDSSAAFNPPHDDIPKER